MSVHPIGSSSKVTHSPKSWDFIFQQLKNALQIHLDSENEEPFLKILNETNQSFLREHCLDCMQLLNKAIELGAVESIHLLIKNGAAVNVTHPSQTNPLSNALNSPCGYSVVKALLEKGAVPGDYDLLSADKNSDPRVIKLLTDRGYKFSTQEIFHHIIGIGKKPPSSEDLEKLEFILKNNPSLLNTGRDSEGRNTPINQVVLLQNRSLFNYLVKKGALLSGDDLLEAMNGQDPFFVDEIVKIKPSLINEKSTSSSKSLLYIAVRQNQPMLTRYLISKGAVIKNGKDIDGNDLLELANVKKEKYEAFLEIHPENRVVIEKLKRVEDVLSFLSTACVEKPKEESKSASLK